MGSVEKAIEVSRETKNGPKFDEPGQEGDHGICVHQRWSYTAASRRAWTYRNQGLAKTTMRESLPKKVRPLAWLTLPYFTAFENLGGGVASNNAHAVATLERAFVLASGPCESIPACPSQEGALRALTTSTRDILTFRYMLLTSLLACSVQAGADPFCIKKSAATTGNGVRYDARTLCHKVIVKFAPVNKLFGGSKEPFLNKPAQADNINNDTKTREPETQALVHGVVSYVASATGDARARAAANHLVLFLHLMIRAAPVIAPRLVPLAVDQPLEQRFQRLLAAPYGGESAVLLVAVALRLLFRPPARIAVYQVNVRGDSQHHIADIDVFSGPLVYYPR